VFIGHLDVKCLLYSQSMEDLPQIANRKRADGGGRIHSKSGVNGSTGARMFPVLLARRGNVVWS